MEKIKKLILVTGGFDPLHSGHIALFSKAAELGDCLVVGINSDQWLMRKKGFCFLPKEERKTIIENLKMVDKVVFWDDIDNSACGAIKLLLSNLNENETIIFANGGDRLKSNIPEIREFKHNKKVGFVFGIGGYNKKNSSSNILKSYIKKLNDN